MSGVAVATIIISISFGEIFACLSAFSAALVAISLVFSSFAAMRRSLMPVRVIETVRSALLERGLERGCRFMITANLLDDMRVDLLFNRLCRHPQCVFDCQWR